MAGRLRSALPAVAAAAAVLLLAAAAPLASAARAQGKGAKITLQAKWEGTPFLHEAAEFLVRAALALLFRPRASPPCWPSLAQLCAVAAA